MLAKLILKYFQHVYDDTSINPCGGLYKIFSILVFTPILLNVMNEWVPWGVFIGTGLLFTTLLVVLNIKNFKEPKTIVFCSLLQLVYGVIFLVRAFLWLVVIAYNAVLPLCGFDVKIKWNPLKAVMVKDGKLSEKTVGTVDVEMDSSESNIMLTGGNQDQYFKDSANTYSENQKAEANRTADIIAGEYGFSSADEAENYGIKTGKQD